MAESLIIQKAIEEVESKDFGFTTQFLEIHEIVYENDKPKVAKVDTDKEDGTAIVYFPVKDERFFFAVYVDTKPEVSVRWVDIEEYVSVYFRASSDRMSLEQLSQITILKPSGGRNKGEPRNPNGEGRVVWKNSTIMFEPSPGADEFEDKLKKLLDFLEKYRTGVKRLV